MLDARAYRVAFLPAFLVLFVVAFSLENRPAPADTTLAPEAFSAARAFGDGPEEPPRNSLLELAAAFPVRPPGSPGDAGVADRVAEELAQDGRFAVRRLSHPADDGRRRVTLQTIVGVRPGISPRRVVVLAHRDARGRGAAAQLSGTAALLELARIADLRDLRRTLVLVSTSGGTIGGAGARAWAQALGDPAQVDAVLVLGDLAGRDSRRPWVLPWSGDRRPAPLALRRTLESAVRSEVGSDPGGARATVQWIRRAVPMSLGEQAGPLAAGLPAVMLQVSGEPGPDPGTEVSQTRFGRFGRAALRAITALDEAPAPRREAGEPVVAATAAGTDGIVTLRKLLPTWAIRLAVVALLLPALLACADACLRLRRQGLRPLSWIAWAALGATPFLLAWAWARVLDLSSALDAPRGAVSAASLPIGAAGALAMLSTAVVAGAAWWLLRAPVVRATGAHGNPAANGTGAVGIATVIAGLALVLAVPNPYAAALLLPAAHGWLLLSAAPGRLPRWVLAAATLAGLALPALAVLVYASSFAMGPLELAWTLWLAASGGVLGVGAAAAIALYLGALGGLLAVLWGRRALRRSADRRPLPDLADFSRPGAEPVGGAPTALPR